MSAYYTSYAFGLEIAAGATESGVVTPKGYFNPQRLTMVGLMAEIRGSFRIRHTRRPPLDRESVIAYSTFGRYKSERRTTVEYRHSIDDSFVRAYLPENVQYVPVDPLSYLMCVGIARGNEMGMLPGVSVDAVAFGRRGFGDSLHFPISDCPITLTLKNCGDVTVRLNVAVSGMEHPRGVRHAAHGVI